MRPTAPARSGVWAEAIRDLAGRENVVCKLGGLAKWICNAAFHTYPEPPASTNLAQAWLPYIDVCIEQFGPARCLFESNFPQEKPSCAYGVFWNACKRMVAGASAAEKAMLFSGTANRVYRLGLEFGR